MVVVSLNDPGIGSPLKYGMLSPQILEPADRLEYDSLPGIRIMPHGNLVPVQVPPVEITAVIPPERIVMIRVVIELADFITAVQHRYAALRKQKCMEHNIKADGACLLFPVMLILGRLDSAQGSCRPCQAGIPEARVIIVQFSSRIGAGPFSGQVIIEILLVGDFLNAERLQESIIQAPADIIVAAQVIKERIFPRKIKNRLQLMPEQPHILRRHRVPGAGHGRYIVEHVAFRFLDRAEIRHYLGRFHDNLSQEQHARAHDLPRHPHQADQRVHLRQVPAGSPESLPYIRNGIKANDIDAVVAQEEHVLRHVVEHGRILIIQVPLIRIERGHHDLVRLTAPGEVTGRCLRKYLGDRLLKLIRDIPVIIEKIPLLVFLLPGFGTLCPLMVLARVIHDEVQAHAHSLIMAFFGKGGQVPDRAELRLDIPEIRYRISSVGTACRAFEERHQMDIIDTALFEVIKMAADALQVP